MKMYCKKLIAINIEVLYEMILKICVQMEANNLIKWISFFSNDCLKSLYYSLSLMETPIKKGES
jgi:hypothetical protein